MVLRCALHKQNLDAHFEREHAFRTGLKQSQESGLSPSAFGWNTTLFSLLLAILCIPFSFCTYIHLVRTMVSVVRSVQQLSLSLISLSEQDLEIACKSKNTAQVQVDLPGHFLQLSSIVVSRK